MIFFENMISALYGEATLGGVKKYFFNICHVAITEKTNSQISFSNLASYHLRSGGNRLLLKLCHRKSVSSYAGQASYVRSVLHAGKIINDESVRCGKRERNYRFLDLQIKDIQHLARVWVVFTCRDVHIAMTRSDVLYI